MIIRHRYSTLLRRGVILWFCFMVSISWVSAQIVPPVSPTYQEICKEQSAQLFISLVGNTWDYQIRWYVWRNSDWAFLGSMNNGPTYNAYEPGEYECRVTKTATGEEYKSSFTLAVHSIPFISEIRAPSICHGGNLSATVDQVNFNDNSHSLAYEWKLGGNLVDNGSIALGEVPKLTLNNVDVSQNMSLLSVTITNTCGFKTSEMYITVWPTPQQPIFNANRTKEYCLGEKASALTINEDLNEAVWYTVPMGGTQLPAAPIPTTSTAGSYTWWVLQKVAYDFGLVCESPRTEAKVIVLPLSDPPLIANHIIPMCLNDSDITLEADGVNLKWYNQVLQSLNAAPQINTSLAADQIYYVTQTEANKCESPKNDDGKMTVRIRNRARTEDIKLSYKTQLCPNNSTIIEATTFDTQIANPIFKWYANSDKTGLIEGNEIQPIPQGGSSLSTPVLVKDTVYYVTLEYSGVCESSYPKAAIINVGDIELPYFIFKDPNRPYLPTDTLYVNAESCQVFNDRSYIPPAADNCTSAENLKIYTDPEAPTYYALGDTTLVWWVEDEANNKVYTLQSIVVIDKIIPWEKKCPKDIIWEIDESENSARVTYELEYEDNCGDVTYELIEGLPSDSIFQFGVTRVVHRISDTSGNTNTCSFNVIVKYPFRPLEVRLSVSANTICPGQEVVITPIVSGGSGRYNYSWKQRYWKEAVIRDYPLTNTTYELTVVDDDGSTLIKTVDITVLETRDVKLVLKDVQMDKIFEGDEVLVEATDGFSSYKLLLNDKVIQEIGLNNRISFQAELGNYFVRVFATDENFCVTQDQLLIEVDSRKLPNAFTPNSSDGKNRLFLEGFDLQVFTRSGELLYQGFDGWNGYYKGKLMPQGTYMYVVRRTMNNGQLWVFKGVVTLKQ